MKKLATAIAITTLGAAIAFAAPQQEGGKAWGHGHHGRHMHGVFSKKLAEKLNLTDAQKAQVKDILKASREQNKAFFQQAHADMKSFFEAKQAGDTAKMDALKPTIESERAQLKALRASDETKIASVLTADQNAQWQQLKAARAARHQK